MLRRLPPSHSYLPELLSCPQRDAVSTDDSCSLRETSRSPSLKPSIRRNKEKSQLCKKYMENGFCPYERKCKFAHGCHELQKNSRRNRKYKTKECGLFQQHMYCSYGDRCNFIHNMSRVPRTLPYDNGFSELRAEAKCQSRLLSLLF